MGREDSISARFLEPGDVIFRDNEWRRVIKIWLDARSCYNKIHTVGENEPDNAISLYEKIPLDFVLRRKSVQVTKQLHFSTAVEEMVTLQCAIEEYDKANNLPEKVGVVGAMFQIDSAIIQRECHEKMMASFNRLKNAINAVKKP